MLIRHFEVVNILQQNRLRLILLFENYVSYYYSYKITDDRHCMSFRHAISCWLYLVSISYNLFLKRHTSDINRFTYMNRMQGDWQQSFNTPSIKKFWRHITFTYVFTSFYFYQKSQFLLQFLH